MNFLDEVGKVMVPTLWVAQQSAKSGCRWYGALPTSVQTAFTLEDDLPAALVRARFWNQRTEGVSESVWYELRDALKSIVRTETVIRDVPLLSIDEIRASREKGRAGERVAYPSILEFAIKDRSCQPIHTCAELLDEVFPAQRSALFTYSSWSKRLRWENEDGSHRLAGAVLAAHSDPTSYLVEARVLIESLDLDSVNQLASGFAAFLLPAVGDPSARPLPPPTPRDDAIALTRPTDATRRATHSSQAFIDLKALLRDARIPYRTATIKHYIRKRDVIFLPYADSKARRLARRLKDAIRPPRREIFATLQALAYDQNLPEFLKAS